MNDDDVIIPGGVLGDLSHLILTPSAQPKTKAAIEGICAGALAHLGKLHSEQDEGSTDKMLIEVAAATLRRVLSGDALDAMEDKIKTRLQTA